MTMEIKQSIVDYFKSKFPSVEMKEIWRAEGKIADELRKMNVGDIILFDVENYNYPTIRSAPGTIMVKERMKEGREWKTRVDYDNQAIAVLRCK